MRANLTLDQLLDRISDPGSGAPTGSSAALAGCLGASLLASVCGAGLESCKNDRMEEELRSARERALSLRRDLLALVEHGARAAEAVAASGRNRMGTARGGPEGERLKALLFASEVPLRTAESCHALLNLSLRVLGRVGVKSIAEIGTGTALSFAGVVGGIVTARTYLASIPAGTGIGAESARKRAERILRDAEALRTQILDRVRKHLP